MNFISELRIFILSLTYMLATLLVCTLFFFLCGLKQVTVLETALTLPLPTEHSFSAQLFKKIVHDIAPADIPLVVTSPFSAFGAQLKIAFMLALCVVFPYLLFRVLIYVKPALHDHEVSLIYKIIAPTTLLFLLGGIFSYMYILPPTFTILYIYTKAIDVTPLLAVDDFISLVLSLIVITGFAFTLPVVMVLLTAIRAMDAQFWVENWRYSILFFLILSAIITPDGSGVSMILLAIPLSMLYGGGVVVSLFIQRKNANTQSIL